MRKILQVTPALPPSLSGVGDYCVTLAEVLNRFGVESALLAAGSLQNGQPVSLAGAASSLNVMDAETLCITVEDLAAEVVLLHFSGYGYARWGLCFWLVDGLRRWKYKDKSRRLVTVFHELYAKGLPWETSFWTSVPQRQIAKSLASLSDAIVCTSASTQARVSSWLPNGRVRMSPVFSNMGELEAPRPLGDRDPTAIVFGGARPRRRFYEQLGEHSHCLDKCFSRLGIEKIIDIGPLVPTPEQVGSAPVEVKGALFPETISTLMANARIGLVDYPLHVITKSGVVAAYFAHGMLCLNTSPVGALDDDLEEGRHFINPANFDSLRLDADAVAAAGYTWYQGHTRARTAELLRDLMMDCCV